MQLLCPFDESRKPNQRMGRKSGEVLPEGEPSILVVFWLVRLLVSWIHATRLFLIQGDTVVNRLTSLPGFEAIADPRLSNDVSLDALVRL